jgi:hypothetical protein
VPTSAPPTTTSTSTSPAAEEIDLTISDELTEGAEEETVTVSLEGSRVATLRATVDAPGATERFTASVAGNYAYVIDAVIWWYDDDGVLQETPASGRGSVYIDDGMRLDVYVHIETDGDISLSLESATTS